jgi:hypothetical protein
MKLNRILSIARNRNATVSRVLTEIIKGGWEKTGWSGKSATQPSDRCGLKAFAKAIRSRDFSLTAALERRATGASVAVLPLP